MSKPALHRPLRPALIFVLMALCAGTTRTATALPLVLPPSALPDLAMPAERFGIGGHEASSATPEASRPRPRQEMPDLEWC